jgi:hypothetical protein
MKKQFLHFLFLITIAASITAQIKTKDNVQKFFKDHANTFVMFDKQKVLN